METGNVCFIMDAALLSINSFVLLMTALLVLIMLSHWASSARGSDGSEVRLLGSWFSDETVGSFMLFESFLQCVPLSLVCPY